VKESVVYAIVRAGGHQEKVSVGDVVRLDLVDGAPGSTLTLPAVMLVDGDSITTDPAALAKASVTAEVVGPAKGPKIVIHKFKNKTGYHKRQGHRQHYTEVRITGVSAG
jgi:large subunit ribosomal protein L21